MIEIIKLIDIKSSEIREHVVDQIKSIFYMSSSLKEFSSEEKKKAFFKRWCGDYIEHYPDEFFLMMEGDQLKGYLSGCLNSKSAALILEVPGYNIFSDLFDQFPAHLHINFHSSCRGRGLGTLLIEKFCDELKLKGMAGVHLVTSPGAANISFYLRSGFSHEVQRERGPMRLLFMGKYLSATNR